MNWYGQIPNVRMSSLSWEDCTCFNFQKAIGKHMENAGLDDPWTEAAVNAAHTTDAMLDGKAYYRAVRGHQLTYEALWHIKWPMFGLWLADNGHMYMKWMSKQTLVMWPRCSRRVMAIAEQTFAKHSISRQIF